MITRLPIQPFDDKLRTRIRMAIVSVFEEQFQKNKVDYDPDTCGRAADNVIALLVSDLLGVEVTLVPEVVIGNGTLEIDTSRSPQA